MLEMLRHREVKQLDLEGRLQSAYKWKGHKDVNTGSPIIRGNLNKGIIFPFIQKKLLNKCLESDVLQGAWLQR